MSDLMQKLALSKAIMDKTEGIKRGTVSQKQEQPLVSDFDIPTAKYNIPNGILDESTVKQSQTREVKPPTIDAIKNSKLPDEIKKLMIEHPIQQPSQSQPVLSDELVEKATRLMKDQNSNHYSSDSKQDKKIPITSNENLNKIVREAVKDILKENGLLLESTEKTNEGFSFKVGKHIFEGKITKIKKLS